jgi:hypothetical protein
LRINKYSIIFVKQNNSKMKKQTTNREYNFPDADLYMQCVERIRYAERDITDFTSYSYGQDRIDAFKNVCAKFNELPSDDEMLGEQMEFTDKKKDAAEKLKTAIRGIMTRVEMKYHNRSGRYRKFGTTKMGDMSDPQLVFCGRRVARVARQQMVFLEEVGVTEAQVTKVLEAAKVFEDAINRKQDKAADRDIMVEVRTQFGNEMYRELIILCNIGKDIWVEKDTVKYEQYVIYESNNDQKKIRKAKLAKEEADKKEE